jgi:signal transduction histidine kinase
MQRRLEAAPWNPRIVSLSPSGPRGRHTVGRGNGRRATNGGSALRRILIVDDDVDVGDSISELLVDEGYEVSVSRDGEQALEQLRRSPADLVIFDLRMPVMDGWEFRTLQRADPILSRIPVIAISADASAKASAIHADRYIRKPFTNDELLLAVERLLLDQERQRLTERVRGAERMALLATMAAGVGHEINNPLTYVLMGVDILAVRLAQLNDEVAEGSAPVLADAASLLKDVRTGAEKIRDVVGMLRSLSRPAAADQGTVDLARAIDTSLAIASHELRHRARVCKVVDAIPPLRGDENRLGQVFVNLLINAAQSIPAGQIESNEVTVRARLEGDRVIVEIRDTGCGINPELHQKIFEPFFTTKDLASGTGLGLPICRNIVHEHGGSIELESAPGQGTLFRVILPYRATPAVGSPVRQAEIAAWSHPIRVLVIDDDALVLDVVKLVLAEEFEVTTALSARDALDRLRRPHSFEVVLCDLMMPEMTGMAFHEALARMDAALAERVVFMTGGAFAPEAQEFLRRVPAPCIDKPFSGAAVREAVRQAARRNQPPLA